MIHLTVQQLSASLDGALAGPSLELVVRHLTACQECRDRQARLTKHDDALRRLLGGEPEDLFLDELTRRAESVVTAIARGAPAPVITTSVPLPHEEDPYASPEPPLPPRGEGPAAQAGWGQFGRKPTGNTQPPTAAPGEAERLLDALSAGDMEAFERLAASGNAADDSARASRAPLQFDFPEWVRDQGRVTVRGAGARDPQPPAWTEEPDPPSEPHGAFVPPPDDDPLARDLHAFESADSEAEAAQLGGDSPAWEPSPADAYGDQDSMHAWQPSPTLWKPDIPSPEYAPYVPPSWDVHPGEVPGGGYAPAGWGAHATDVPPEDWQAHGDLDLPVLNDITPFEDAPAAAADESTDGRPPRRRLALDRTTLFAVFAVGALLLVILALQLVPATPAQRAAAPAPSRFLGVHLPEVQFLKHDVRRPVATHPRSQVRTAAEPPPLDQVIPPVVPPDDDGWMDTEAAPPLSDSAAAGPIFGPALPAHAMVPAGARDVQTGEAAENGGWPLLCGRVEDGAGVPVAGARVSIAEISYATRTDARGRFCMSAPIGAHSLFVEASGFTPERQSVTFTTSPPEAKIRLQPAR